MTQLKSQSELEIIRQKIESRQTDFKKMELDCLKSVYEEIQSTIVQKNETLNISCSGCVSEAIKVVYNYITFHEVKPSQGKSAKVQIVEDPNASLTLSELREKYPNIKSNSKDGFLKKLNEKK